MAVRAGQILHLGGDQTVIDRLQSAGLGDINIGVDQIRETGNPGTVDKVQQDPDFTFSMESFDVSTEIEALLAGEVDGGSALPIGTAWRFSDLKCIHITSPWKDEASGSAGTIDSGVLLPNYYVQRASYRFGVNDNAGETFELAGSQIQMAEFNPTIEVVTGDGAEDTFVLAASAVRHRVGGYESGEVKYLHGVIVDNEIMIEGSDYAVTHAGSGATTGVTVEFTEAPANGADIQFAYFDTATPSYPVNTATHTSPTVKPAAVRGRDIRVRLHVPDGGAEASGAVTLNGIQSVTVEGTRTTEQEREMGTLLPISRTVTQQDVNGEVGVHPSTQDHLFTLLRRITGVAANESISIINDFPVGLEVQILNPRDRSEVLKTIWVPDAKFQIPGTPARAGAVVDFTMRWESSSGDFWVIKGEDATLPSA
jgi:hypothetical protein